MNRDFLTSANQCDVKNAETLQKGSSYQKAPKEPKREQKGPIGPQSTQECPTEISDDFLTPADQFYVQNAETSQKDSHY